MRYLKSPTFVIGVVLAAAGIVALRPNLQADLGGPSRDVSAAIQISPLAVVLLLLSLALIGTSLIGFVSRRHRRS